MQISLYLNIFFQDRIDSGNITSRQEPGRLATLYDQIKILHIKFFFAHSLSCFIYKLLTNYFKTNNFDNPLKFAKKRFLFYF